MAGLRQVGHGKRFVVNGKTDTSQAAPDRYLLRLLGQAHRYKAMVMRGDGRTISDLASDAGVSRTYFAKILRLAFLSPDVVRMIMSGRQPRELSARRLAEETRLRLDWQDHRRYFDIQ